MISLLSTRSGKSSSGRVTNEAAGKRLYTWDDDDHHHCDGRESWKKYKWKCNFTVRVLADGAATKKYLITCSAHSHKRKCKKKLIRLPILYSLILLLLLHSSACDELRQHSLIVALLLFLMEILLRCPSVHLMIKIQIGFDASTVNVAHSAEVSTALHIFILRSSSFLIIP